MCQWGTARLMPMNDNNTTCRTPALAIASTKGRTSRLVSLIGGNSLRESQDGSAVRVLAGRPDRDLGPTTS